MSIPFKKRIVLFFVLVIFLAGWLFSHKALVRVSLRTDTRGPFKIYWAGATEPFSEVRSASVWINPHQSQYAFFLADLKKIRKLRIDPLDRPGNVVIRSIEISQVPYETVRFSAAEGPHRLKPLQQIIKLDVKKEGIAVETGGKDPQLATVIEAQKRPTSWMAAIFQIVMLAVVFTFLLQLVTRLSSGYDYVPQLMFFILALIMCMNLVSRYNMHPDEYVHVQAGTFYEDHWLPPAICAPGTETTYSVYGVSRLNSFEIVYFFAGKFSRLLRLLPLEAHLRMRFFNLCLFAVLLWLCLLKSEHRILYLPLLISPQVWYVFSYFNSDAFCLFICFMLGYQLLESHSMLNRLLHDDFSPVASAARLVGIALIAGMLPLLKLNFYFYGIFLVGFLLIRLFQNGFSVPARTWRRAGLVVVAALVLAACRFGVDVHLNGWHRSQKLTDCRNQLARPKFKPNTPLKARSFGLNLKKRGTSAREMFSRYGWGRVSFQSTFGVYGYMAIYGSHLYYRAAAYLVVLLAVFLAFSALFRSSFFNKLDLANVVICSLALVAATFWNSWNVDLQNQGRYFLPIFAMIGVLLVQIEKRINSRLLNPVVLTMFALSVYSFLFYGLAGIPKTG